MQEQPSLLSIKESPSPKRQILDFNSSIQFKKDASKRITMFSQHEKISPFKAAKSPVKRNRPNRMVTVTFE